MQVGLIGFPVGHSISPAFQQAAFDALGLDVQYQLWETSADRIAEVVGRLRQPDFLGANVTIPHKQAVASLLDSVDPVARVVGAVNTIVRADDRLVGYNTDVEGFTRALEIDGGSSMSSRRFVVLGAGGAARAVVTAILLGEPASVVILARRTEQAIALLKDL
ncbi:MAG TPA: shikimate dehydrogenase, partial [Chloroflexota bacterium]|nr:shikimate dehydrogenase [Chloroflexota bacterium]